ncbi:ABC transporter ATP-binding protein [Actinotalea ferrariae]|uniref:ABC transporter ATP-binding protein n=1 Tax=Actinotalea ferrariae TaxID=1386098 RepID=UPI001C8C2C3F|nr:ABC transporter ATP-binding protein [Actinotalea ferrariae]MBX9244588.1 ABC transporter ATP-binding protein [Actinotalea ferrariae]
MRNNAPAAVRVAGLRVVRGGTEVLGGLHLAVPAGQVVGLLGPSGSGKTTLMRAVVGVQETAGGEVEVLGLPAGHRDLRRRVGYVSQAPSVYADLTVAENLRYFATVLGAGRADVARVLGEVDLGRMAGRRVGALSGGERSRVSLGVALLARPELLVLDEPTVGLDPVLRRDLWQLFHRLSADGTSLLISSHVMDEAQRCDRLVLLRDGRVLADSTLPDLLASTGAADVEAAFLHLVEDGAAPAAHLVQAPAGRHAAAHGEGSR